MEDKYKIFKLIAVDPRFEVLTSRLTEFNPFKILKVQDYEIRHSNFLGWLFDPSQNHNLDDKILTKFLFETMMSQSNGDRENGLNIFNIYQNGLLDAKVFREYRNIDILIVSELNKLVILIENKVDSKEHSNQLKKYLDIVEEDFSGKYVFPVLLSLDGQMPSNDKYYIATYRDIIGVVESITIMNNDRMPSDIFSFIQFYVRAVKERFGMDAEFVKLCRDIYREHREAIENIYLYGKGDKIAEAFELFVKDKDFVESGNKPGLFYVINKDIAKEMKSKWFTNNIAAIWFSKHKDDCLQIVLEVGPFIDGNQRVNFIKHAETKGLKFSKVAKQEDSIYSRTYSKWKRISDSDGGWDNEELISDIMAELYEHEDMQKAIAKLKDSIETFEWQ